MTTKQSDDERAEAYARALVDAGRAEGRSNADLVQWLHAVKFSPEVLEALGAMHKADDLDLIDKVSQDYKDILDHGDDAISVTVTTAVPLDDKLRKEIIDKAKADFGSDIYLVERIDPSILGGIILEERGNRYDASVRAQLSNIRKQLASTFVGGDTDE